LSLNKGEYTADRNAPEEGEIHSSVPCNQAPFSMMLLVLPGPLSPDKVEGFTPQLLPKAKSVKITGGLKRYSKVMARGHIGLNQGVGAGVLTKRGQGLDIG